MSNEIEQDIQTDIESADVKKAWLQSKADAGCIAAMHAGIAWRPLDRMPDMSACYRTVNFSRTEYVDGGVIISVADSKSEALLISYMYFIEEDRSPNRPKFEVAEVATPEEFDELIRAEFTTIGDRAIFALMLASYLNVYSETHHSPTDESTPRVYKTNLVDGMITLAYGSLYGWHYLTFDPNMDVDPT